MGSAERVQLVPALLGSCTLLVERRQQAADCAGDILQAVTAVLPCYTLIHRHTSKSILMGDVPRIW